MISPTITPVRTENVSQLFNQSFVNHKTAKSTQNEFINFFDSVSTQEDFRDFVKLSSQNIYANKLFEGAVLSGLPPEYAKCELGTESRSVRDIIGILYRGCDEIDKPKFHKVFDEIIKNKNILPDEKIFSSELTYLFKKYSESALHNFAIQYKDKCCDAWQYHHHTNGKNISYDEIFTPAVISCFDVIQSTIKRMQEPNQSWSTIFANGIIFKKDILAISKTMYLHNHAKDNTHFPTGPSTHEPQKDFSTTPRLQQPGIRKPDISIPEKNGQINIYNTANGGQGGNATVNSNTPLSDSDFGIRLLATPHTELVNEKAYLVEKYMDLRWGRAKNGGQDKFSDHVDSVVQRDPHPQSLTEVLQYPPVLQTVGKSFTQQPAMVAAFTPQPNIGQGEVNIAEQKMHGVEVDSISVPAELPIFLVPDNTNYNSQNVLSNQTVQVVPEVSSLLTEINTSQNVQGKLQDRLTTGVYLESAPLVRVQGNPNSSVALETSRMLHLAPYSEALNIKQHIYNESLSNIGALNRSKMENDSLQLIIAHSEKTDFQPVKRGVKQLKFSVKVNQAPTYTTNRTIDLFSRRSVDLKKPFQFIKLNKEEEPKAIIPNNDSVSII